MAVGDLCAAALYLSPHIAVHHAVFLLLRGRDAGAGVGHRQVHPVLSQRHAVQRTVHGDPLAGHGVLRLEPVRRLLHQPDDVPGLRSDVSRRAGLVLWGDPSEGQVAGMGGHRFDGVEHRSVRAVRCLRQCRIISRISYIL